MFLARELRACRERDLVSALRCLRYLHLSGLIEVPLRALPHRGPGIARCRGRAGGAVAGGCDRRRLVGRRIAIPLLLSRSGAGRAGRRVRLDDVDWPRAAAIAARAAMRSCRCPTMSARRCVVPGAGRVAVAAVCAGDALRRAEPSTIGWPWAKGDRVIRPGRRASAAHRRDEMPCRGASPGDRRSVALSRAKTTAIYAKVDRTRRGRSRGQADNAAGTA
jgi:hypothetical protein